MKVSYNCLSSYVDLTEISVEKLADSLTNAGLEVEGIEKLACAEQLVVGEVIRREAHPDSDHLSVCQVNIGSEILQIVCGAPNVRNGQKVIVAKVGARLPEIEIKAATIRGVESSGMICSLAELGVDKRNLSAEQLAGIEVLPITAAVGDENPLALLGLDDSIIDVSLTPNRNDCLALWALAKEVGAILERKVSLPAVAGISDTGAKTKLRIISETELCPLFLGKIIGSVTIKQSPEWLQKALLANGIKSINNVVDISNYVMLETGQPLHFYDLAKIPAQEVTVRADRSGEYTALDGISYKIEKGDLMITTGGHNIGIAGVMGGDDSKIEASTKAIIIEAALFERVAIRKTARRLNLQTESSTRFQKGLEPLAPYKAMDRAVELLLELADAKLLEETVIHGKKDFTATAIETSPAFHNRLLGTDFTAQEIIDVFRRLDFNPASKGEQITVTIPSYRTDISIEADLTEEIIRLLGFEHVQSTLPVMESFLGGLAENENKRRRINELLVGFGFQEIMTYSLVSSAYLEDAVMPLGEAVELANPMSEERKYYRTSLLPAMLEVIAYNQARSQENYSLFEIANVYDKSDKQEERLTMALSNKITLSRWQKLVRISDFYIMKGYLQEMLKTLGFEEKRIYIKPNDLNNTVFHPNQSAAIYIDKNLLGIFGRIHPQIQQKYGLENCLLAELNLTTLYQSQPAAVRYKAISRYPSVYLDIAIVIAEDVAAGEVVNTIRKSGGKLISEVEIFDVYQGENIPDGKKSLAIRIQYQSFEKTLSDEDVMPLQEKIIESLKREYAAIYRDK